MSKSKLLVLVAVAVILTAFFSLDLGRYFTFEYLRAQQDVIAVQRAAYPLRTALVYFAVYVLFTGLSLPGALAMTVVGGAVFGLAWGTVLVSFASTVGATIAFLMARFLLRDYVQSRFGDHLHAVNEGMRKDGTFYLLTLRLVPVFPFFMVNLAMGLTPIRTAPFFVVSQIGMLAGTLVYVNAGTQLAKIDSLAGVLSPGLLASFTVLGLFPLIARKLVGHVQARRALRAWPRPRRFERDLVVIGAGSAGLTTAYIGAALRARVTLVERARMGGDCLNTGCVPSKALIRTTRLLAQMGRAREYGLKTARAEFDFGEVMERVQRVVTAIAPHDSVERYEALGVECLQGQATIESPYAVRVGERVLTTRNIVVAAGARPAVPPVPGLEEVGYVTSDDLWGLRALPRRLLVLGGGPIGCELAQCFARLGAAVVQVEMLPRLLAREDREVSVLVEERFRAEGIDVRTGYRARQFHREGEGKVVVCVHEGGEARFEFDQVLVAVGRQANTEGYGLETIGLPLTPAGTLEVNEYMQTRIPNVFACGDVAGPYQFTHVSAHQAWHACVNALFGTFRRFPVSYAAVPHATFTEPEVARVGLNVLEAEERGVAYEATTYGIDELDRAIADEEAYGFVKVLTVPGKDRILGATVVGAHAGDIIAEFVTAMTHRIGLNKVLSTIHTYPTMAEANKYAAGAWKRAHVPVRVLGWLARYHALRRG